MTEGVIGFNPKFPTVRIPEFGAIPIGVLTATVEVREMPGIIVGGVSMTWEPLGIIEEGALTNEFIPIVEVLAATATG